MDAITTYDMKQNMIKFLYNLIKELKQGESINNPMIECSIDINRDITKLKHKLCKKEMILKFRYEEDAKQ